MKIKNNSLLFLSLTFASLTMIADCASAEISESTKTACKAQCESATASKAEKASCLMKCVKEKDGKLPEELQAKAPSKDTSDYIKHLNICNKECKELFTERAQSTGCVNPCIVKRYADLNQKAQKSNCTTWKTSCTNLLKGVQYEGCKDEFFTKACS